MTSDQKYILAIDEGTTSTRTIIIDHNGQKVVDAQREFPQYFPHPGWVEHNANEIWNAALSTIATAFIESQIQPRQIVGIGITNQRETRLYGTNRPGCQSTTPSSGSRGKLARSLTNLRQMATAI